jgi:hypothetical protein
MTGGSSVGIAVSRDTEEIFIAASVRNTEIDV